MNEDDFKKVFNLPFTEAENFFRNKLNIPTNAWNDLEGAAHAKGFMSAGAYNADLLNELRGMVDKAVAGKMDIKEFRSQFKALVNRHGWQLKGGGPAWRSDLIWRTNTTTAHQAGRWQQFEDGGIDYLKYVHNDGVMHPRPNHVAMDGTVLPRTDPFWQVNYPPNGWGCRCRAVAAMEHEVTDRPAGWPNLAENGWDYNVGLAGAEKGYRALTDKFESLPNDIARVWLQRFVQEPAFDRFVAGQIESDFPVAILRPADMTLLGSESQVVWFSSDSLAKNKGEIPVRSQGHPDLTLADYRLIPRIIDEGEVYKQSDARFIYLKVGEMLYRAALKRTKDGARNYLLSLMKVTEDSRAVKQVREKYERLR